MKIIPQTETDRPAPQDAPKAPAVATSPPAPAKPPREPSHVTRLLALAKDVELLATPDGRCVALAPVHGHTEVLSVGERGSDFRQWLLKKFRQEGKGLPSTTALGQVMEALAAEARFSRTTRDVHTRIAHHQGAIYLDLANEAWQVVEITRDGWRVMTNPPVLFRRPSGMLALPVPDDHGTLDDLWGLFPVERARPEALLMMGWLLGTFLPSGAMAILGIHGEHGTAKSTTTRHLRRLVDPNKALARSAPKEERDLAIAASNSAVVALENLSHMPEWLSDMLCTLSTGAGFSTRSLYTDDDEMIFAFKRPVVMNGIAEVAVRGDLIDRCLFVTLPPIADTERKTERAIDAHFQAHHATALGALLDCVCTALANQPHVTMDRPPRMADFALWVEAAAPALGWTPGAFLHAYTTNRQHAAAMELDASPLASELLTWLALPATTPGTLRFMKGLLQELTDLATDYGKTKAPAEWPRSPQALSSRLKRYAPALRREGWHVVYPPRAKAGQEVAFEKCDSATSDAGVELGVELGGEVKSSTPTSTPANANDVNHLVKGVDVVELSLPSSVETEAKEKKEDTEKDCPESSTSSTTSTPETEQSHSETDSERAARVSPTSNASGLGLSDATFPRGRPLPDEAEEVLSRVPSEAPEGLALDRFSKRISSPSPLGSGAAGAGALACSCGGFWLPTGDGRCTRCNAVRP